MATSTPVIDTSPVDLRAAAAIERAEARAWADMYAAAPPRFAETAGVAAHWMDGALVLRWSASGRRYFSRAIGLGIATPATRSAIDAIIAGYERNGISMFLLQSLPHCLPAAYDDWFRERGLEPFDTQDRIIRGAQPLPALPRLAPDRDLTVERVGDDGIDEWSEFLQRVYVLDTGDWLPQLVGRRSWHQYVAREAGRIVAARGMYIDADGLAWLGMDGPVPGLGTTDYEPDAVICDFAVREGLRLGARGFVMDIEAASPTMETPAYQHFARLGFRLPYARTHYARLQPSLAARGA